MQGKLIEELREWTGSITHTHDGANGDEATTEAAMNAAKEYVGSILSRHEAEQGEGKAVEPLAVLADRKGWWIEALGPNRDNALTDVAWAITINKENEGKDFCAPTYAAAEQAARAYLTALADKEGV